MATATTKNQARQILRMVEVRGEQSDGSIEVVIATENPVPRYCERRRAMVPEYLVMEGAQLPASLQLPMVDSHDVSTVKNCLGSLRRVRIEDGDLRPMVANAYFAADAESQEARQKLLDGHLTDFSITADTFEIDEIQRGESRSIRAGGVEVEGPADLVRLWRPTDASLVITGADTESKVRRLFRSYFPSEGKMKVKLIKRRRVVQRSESDTRSAGDVLTALTGAGVRMDQIAGMVEVDEDDLTTIMNGEAEADEELTKALRALRMEPVEDTERADGEDNTERSERSANNSEALTRADLDKAVQRAQADERARQIKRVKEIRALCTQCSVGDDVAQRMINDGTSIAEARQEVIKVMARGQSLGTSHEGSMPQIRNVSRTGDEAFYNASRDALILRSLAAIPPQPGVQRKKHVFRSTGTTEPARGHEDFDRMGLFDLAKRILQRGHINTDRLERREVALVAMGHTPTIQRLQASGRIARSGDAWHTTGVLPNILLDAVNVTLQAGYDEAEFTWKIWARQGAPADDLKQLHRVRFSEAPDPEVVPEGKAYPETKTTDAKESYAVDKYGKIFSITWETIVNDSLDAISRIPQMHGNACRRKQNKVVYAVLTANEAMSDGVALFHSSHGNLAGSAAAISVASLNAAYKDMRTQTGLKDEIIQVVPRFLIVPPSISGTADQLVRSLADPDAGGTSAGNSNTHNPYGPDGRRRLVVVEEPQLEANSATRWYLAASNAEVDTVEITFLKGEESPVIETEWDFTTDTYKNKVRQNFAAKAIDHRGLYRNDGA